MFEIKKCKKKAAYTAKPKNNLKLDLDGLKNKFEVVFDSPLVLVLKIDEEEVVVHKYGELIFKKCEDMDKMEKIAKKIFKFKKEN